MEALLSEIFNYLDVLSSIEYYDEALEMSVFPESEGGFGHELSVTKCTCSAMLIAKKFNGAVFGYPMEEDDSPLLAGFDSLGHDFCVVGPYLVDWWTKNVEDPNNMDVLNMNDPADREIIKTRYLPEARWKKLDLWN